ncbi:MAG: D-alanyl-D-alanine carboxypeptidase [Acidimicrobiales bacterium]|nr:D-alanyl-D-alanine carboxypeptidase [Hyphomonadaceae bacterium]RZV36308.1 MAG: D-alanyl-D-alanine carboxypeptidase [Acidimicrobiales bacterium]
MRLFISSIALFLAFSLSALSFAQDDNRYFPTPAKHLIIIDHDSGEILFEKNARVPMAPASMTKIMTASVVFDRLKSGTLSLTDEFEVSENAWRRGGAKSGSSTMFLDLNSKASVSDLLRGVIVQSGNDACIVLAEAIAGSESNFAKMMNDKAEELGLTTANFKNSTGWPDDEHVISAYDLAILSSHTINEHPELYKIYAERSFKWNGITQPNRNPLFGARSHGADGLKTGHTEISKYGFVGSAVRDGKRRIFVVNGLESKAQRRLESIRIMNAAFNAFNSYGLFKSGDKVGSADVYMGVEATVPLIVKSDVSVGLHKAQRSDLKVSVQYKGPVAAPVAEGDEIAKLVISAEGMEDRRVPLYAGASVARKSFFGRFIAGILQKIRG